MSSNWFSIHLETRAPTGDCQVIDEDAADALVDLLEEHSGVVSAGDCSWDATVSVPANDVREAAERGTSLIEHMAVKAGMPSWPAVRSEVVREDIQTEDLARPTLPELVSVPEAADILGVSAQRVHELSRTSGFPEPVYELRTGKLWLRAGMEAYAERRPRQPGRPVSNGANGLAKGASADEPFMVYVVDKARHIHPSLGDRQAEVLAMVAAAGDRGTTTRTIWHELIRRHERDFDRAGVHIALSRLLTLALVDKDTSAWPHVYRLGPALRSDVAKSARDVNLGQRGRP